jgi:hypothetical protein
LGPHTCGRRAPDGSGNAPSKIERFGRRLDSENTQSDLDFQEIETTMWARAGSALRRRAHRQAQTARDRTCAGEATIAQRLPEAFNELASELEAEAGQ